MTNVGNAQDENEMAVLEPFFSAAVKSTGIVYAQARSAILTRPQQAQAFLRAKAKSGATTAERRLAKILLVRLARGKDFGKLAQEFHERVWNLKFRPEWSRRAPPSLDDRRAIARAGLLTWDDYLKLEARFKTDPSFKSDIRSLESIKRFRLSRSADWSIFIEELLLKGWVPTVQVTNPTGRWGYPFKDRAAEKAGPKLNPSDYTIQAVVLSGKLKILQNRDRLLQMLQDQHSSDDIWATAATALGQLAHKKAAPALMKLITDEKAPRFLRQAAFFAIGEGKFVAAVPLLKKIGAWTPSEPGKKDARHWAFTARNALIRIRMKQKK